MQISLKDKKTFSPVREGNRGQRGPEAAAVSRSGPSGRQRRPGPVPTRGGLVAMSTGAEAAECGGRKGSGACRGWPARATSGGGRPLWAKPKAEAAGAGADMGRPGGGALRGRGGQARRASGVAGGQTQAEVEVAAAWRAVASFHFFVSHQRHNGCVGKTACETIGTFVG
jgi:hypothetical protein